MPTPNEAAIKMLRDNPDLAPQFDEVFGAGASAQYLQEQNGGVIDVVVDVAKGADDLVRGFSSGIVDAVQNAGDFMAQMSDAVGIPSQVAIGDAASNGVIEFMTAEEAAKRGLRDPFFGKVGEDDDPVLEPETVAGNIVQGVSQFLTSYVAASKFTKAANIAQGAGALTTAVRGGLNSALGSFFGFDPQEERLSNLLIEYPALRNPVTEYLAADPNDGEVEGRFKNALEDIGLGILAEGLLSAVKAIRAARKAAAEGGQEAAEAVLKEAAPEIEKQLDLFYDLPAPAAADAEAAVKGVAKGAAQAEKAAEVSLKNREAAGVPSERPRPEVDTDMLREAIRRSGAGGGLDIDLGDMSGRIFNWDKLDSPNRAKEVIRQTAVVMGDYIDSLIGTGRYTFDQMQRDAAADLAQMVNLGTDHLIYNISKQAAPGREMVSHLLAGKVAMQSMAREIADLAAKIDANPMAATKQDELLLVTRLQQLAELESGVKAIQTTAARVTAAGRIVTRDALSGNQLRAAELLDEMAKSGDIRAFAAKLARTKGNPLATIKLAQRSAYGRAMDMLAEYYVNSLLSGPKTHNVNMLSNTINTVILPAEKMVGSVLTADRQAFMEGAYTYLGLVYALRDSVRLASQAFKAGTSVLDPGSNVDILSRHAIRSDRTDLFGQMINGFGSFVRLPTRLMLTQDEFFKQINYRATVYAQAAREAAQKFPDDAKARALYIQDRLDRAVDPATGQFVDEAAIQVAREATFQTALKPGSIGHALQTFASQHPGMRLIVPFIKTPTNILRSYWARTPGINLLQRQFREDLFAGGERTQRALGKMATGSLLYATAISLAAEGRITGAGPLDPADNQALRQTGWRPFSFVFENEDGSKSYVPYSRFAPWSLFFGTTATFMEVFQYGALTDAEIMEIAEGMMTALSESVGDQTYLQGAVDFLTALLMPHRFGKRFMEQFAAGFVPTGLQQVSRAFGGDQYMREVDGVLDAIKAKVPGLSATLPPRRSWLTGEPIPYDKGIILPGSITPLTIHTVQPNVVYDEMVKLGFDKRAPAKTIGNVELTPEQYDRLLELHGTIKVQGKTLMQRLEHEIRKPSYDLNRERYQDVTGEYRDENRRLIILEKVVAAYREAAKAQLAKEFPELRQALIDEKRNRAAARSGNQERIEQLLNQN